MGDPIIDAALDDFLARSAFATRGGIVTDLDGTAVHEVDGRVVIHNEVIAGLKALRDVGRPLALNTLRFPLNVVRTFGRAWYDISSKPVPLVSLNGAIVGELDVAGEQATFRELVARPLAAGDIATALDEVTPLVDGGEAHVLVFLYPRDWTAGEIIWTPNPERVPVAVSKYASASEVFTGSLADLRTRLMATEICMMFVLVEVPADRRMAYQHARPASFITAHGVDKLAGARIAAEAIGFDLAESVGAGDTPMDNFLAGVGLGVHVGPMPLDFRARYGQLRLPMIADLGPLLFSLARV